MNELIAHRGLKKDAKENTLEAIKKAIENKNYAGFECDVRTTKDHVFVIHHNPMIKEDIISLTNYQKLKEKHQINSLEDILKIPSKKIFLLELKEYHLNIPKLLKVIKKYPHQKIYLMSFYNQLIKKIPSSTHYKKGVLNYVLNSEEDYKSYDFICLLESIATPKLLEYFKDNQIETFLYNIHNPKNLEADYIITDEIIDNEKNYGMNVDDHKKVL